MANIEPSKEKQIPHQKYIDCFGLFEILPCLKINQNSDLENQTKILDRKILKRCETIFDLENIFSNFDLEKEKQAVAKMAELYEPQNSCEFICWSAFDDQLWGESPEKKILNYYNLMGTLPSEDIDSL